MRGEPKVEEKLDRSALNKFRKTMKDDSRLIKVSDKIKPEDQEK